MALTKADIDWLEATYLPKMVDAVKDKLKQPMDDLSSKLDTFIGEIKTRREEDILHAGEHDRFEKRVSALEKCCGIKPHDD